MRSMIDQGHLRNGEIETQRDTTPKSAFLDAHRGTDGRALVVICRLQHVFNVSNRLVRIGSL